MSYVFRVQMSRVCIVYVDVRAYEVRVQRRDSELLWRGIASCKTPIMLIHLEPRKVHDFFASSLQTLHTAAIRSNICPLWHFCNVSMCGRSTNHLEVLVVLCSGSADIVCAATYKWDARQRHAITRLWNSSPNRSSRYPSRRCQEAL